MRIANPLASRENDSPPCTTLPCFHTTRVKCGSGTAALSGSAGPRTADGFGLLLRPDWVVRPPTAATPPKQPPRTIICSRRLTQPLATTRGFRRVFRLGRLIAPELFKERLPQHATFSATGVIVRANGGLHHYEPGFRVDNNRLTVNAHQCKGPSRTGW